MTSPMTWSNESISKITVSKITVILVGLALAALIGSGCAARNHPNTPLRLHGFVNLDVLTHQHPGWSGVGRYDTALRRLETAANTLPPPGRPDDKIATLPALPVEPGRAEAALSPAQFSLIRGRLASVQLSLVAELRGRREMARADQLRGQQAVWRREARTLYPVPTVSVPIQPDLELQLLEANVKALTQTLNNWRESTPPAPDLEALRAKVEANRARLETLISLRLQARETADAALLAETERLRAARGAYVQAQTDMLEAHLRGDDEHVIADHERRLARQETALLGALAQPLSIDVPSAGDLGAKSLPTGRGAPQAALSQASLTAAEARLRAQRARWIQYLHGDTRAAARDTAGQRNWDVTFGLPRPGDQDLTQTLAQAMTSGVWHLSPKLNGGNAGTRL
jgi:hypothetical protein